MASTAALDLIIRLRDEASKGIATISSGLGDIAKTAAGFALGGILQDAGSALVGFGASSISVAGEFEAGMNRLASVTGDSLADAGLSLDDFQAKFLELGAETQFSAAQAQDAAIALAKGGIPVADILGNATAATLGLAAAGELELGPAADIVAKQLGVWADTGVDAATVANQLAQAANASTVDVDELALGLANVGGTAKVAGVDFGDLTQTMALIAPSFSSASDAGTSLATMIRGFQPTTAPAREAMRDIGLLSFDTQKALTFLAEEGIKPASNDFQDIARSLSQYALANEYSVAETNKLVDSFNTSVFYDAQGAFVGMEEASRLLAGATGDLSEAEKVMALSTIFGSDAIRAASAVAEAGAPGFAAMGDAMTNAGSAADQAAIKQQGFAFALDSLKGTMETVQIVVGGALLPVLTDLLNNAIIPATNGILTFAQNLLAAGDPIAFLVSQVDALLPGFQGVVDVVSANIVPILASLGAMLLAVVVPAFVAWTAAAWASATATIAALAPVIAPIAAIGAAVGLLVLAWQNDFGGIATFLTGWWEGTGRPIFEQLQQWLQVHITAAIAALSAYWTNTLQPALQQVWAFIQANVIPLLVNLGGTVLTQLGQAVQVLAQFWTSTLWPAIQAVAGWISGTLVPLLVAIGSVYFAAVSKAVELAAAVFTNVLMPPLQTLWKFVSDNLSPVLDALGRTVLPPVKEAMSALASIASGALASGLSSLKTLLNDVRTFLGYINDRIQDTIEFFGELADSISSISIPSWLQGHSPPPLADWLAYIESAGQAADAALAQFGGTAASLAADIKNFSRALVDDAFKGVIGLARGQIDAIDAIRGLGADTGGVEAAQDEARSIMEDRQRLGEQIVDQEQKLAELIADDPNDPQLKAERERLALLYEQNDVMARQHRQALDAVRAAEQQQQFMQEIARSAQGALEAALSEAEALQATDPASASAFFDLRQRQIVELAELQKRLATTESDAEFQALSRQRVLLEAAQAAERLRFDEDMRRRQEERQDQIDQINEGLGGLTWTDNEGEEHTLAETDPRWAALFQGLTPLTGVFTAAAEGVTTLLDRIGALPVFSSTAPGTSGPLGPNPVIQITINGTAPANVQAQIQQGVQQGLAAAGINADLRRRQL